jgi:hypothetical protein
MAAPNVIVPVSKTKELKGVRLSVADVLTPVLTYPV